jgi:hypothetical protein
MLLAATGDERLDPSLANLLAVFVMVIAAAGVERIRTLGAGCPSAGSQAVQLGIPNPRRTNRPLTALATRLT